jgi:hypothetical protein
MEFPAMSTQEFGIAFGVITAVWLQREWRSAKFENNAK